MEDGTLTVGPESAGAQPGPVCYGAGGEEPTVTDAHLVLGRIPAHLLGGEIALDVERARRAIEERVARPLGLPLESALVVSFMGAALILLFSLSGGVTYLARHAGRAQAGFGAVLAEE